MSVLFDASFEKMCFARKLKEKNPNNFLEIDV